MNPKPKFEHLFPEYVAFMLMEKAGEADGTSLKSTADYWIQLYARCLKAVKGENSESTPQGGVEPLLKGAQ